MGRRSLRIGFPCLLLVAFAISARSLPVFSAATNQIDELRKQIAEKDAAVRELENRANAAKAQLAELRGAERTLANEIAILDRQIESLELELEITEDRIASAELRIEELSLQIAQQEEAIARNRARLGEILRAIQAEEDRISTVALVFSGRPFSEIFDTLRASELLDASLAEGLRALKQAKANLEAAKTASEEEQRAAAVLRDELRVRRALLTSQQDERETLLSETKQEERNYQNLLKDIERQQLAIQREILQLEAQLRRAIHPSALPQRGVLQWPVASARITQGYGPTSETGFVNDAYEFHNGIDFGASSPGVVGDPIFAAAPGTVVGVGNDGKYAYGRWIAIDHHNGLVTLYAHLQLQEVGVGDTVKGGQVIGRMGSTGFSTGPHLHFTVYASETFRIEARWYGPLPLGGSLNPLDFLE